MNCCLQKYTTHQFTFFYILFISRQVQEFKNYQNHQVHQELHTKQFQLFCLTCFPFVLHLNLK